MKKKGFNFNLKLLAIFLALCAITLYVPNGVVTASADIIDDAASAVDKSDFATPTETYDTEWGYVENETEYIYTEEDESETGMEFTGGMVEIQPPGETEADPMIDPPDITVIIKEGEGGSRYIEDGVYAFQNKGSVQTAHWMDVQQGQVLPGYEMQNNEVSGDPTVTFDRSCLFKITRRPPTNGISTSTYIIRSMLNNRLTFYFTNDGKVLTKEIPPNDEDVDLFDTFIIEFDIANNCILIKPFSITSDVVSANPNLSHLIKSTECLSGDYAKWFIHKYEGETKSGTKPVFTPATTGGALIKDKMYSIKITTWTTEINKNTPYAMVHPDSVGMATESWNPTTYTLTLTAEQAGAFKLRTIIRGSDNTAFRTYYGNYPIIPDIVGDTTFVENVGTGRYIDIEGPSTANNAIIQQWQFNGKNQSKWIFEQKSNGYFAIKSKYSSKYIGVDSTNTTVIRQYSTQSDYTLWRIVSTTSGNYKLVCKAIESSGLVLAVPLNANSNGTNLTMITYTDDTNLRDEWRIKEPIATLSIEIKVDLAYAERFPNYSTRISNSMYIIRERFFELFDVIIEYSVVSTFESLGDYCDSLSGGNYMSQCSHGSNTSCTNASGFGESNHSNTHHKNIYNIMYEFERPDLTQNTILVFIGHENLCQVVEGVHGPYTSLGRSWVNSGISCITNNGTELNERRTILHEIGHWYQGEVDLDHAGELSMNQLAAGFRPNCIYGQYKNDELVMEDLTICQGCQDAIRANLTRFDHE